MRGIVALTAAAILVAVFAALPSGGRAGTVVPRDSPTPAPPLTTPVPASPDLKAEETAPAKVLAFKKAHLQLKVTNTGSAAATGVQLVALVPPRVSFKQPPADCTATHAPNGTRRLTCLEGDMTQNVGRPATSPCASASGPT